MLTCMLSKEIDHVRTSEGVWTAGMKVNFMSETYFAFIKGLSSLNFSSR